MRELNFSKYQLNNFKSLVFLPIIEFSVSKTKGYIITIGENIPQAGLKKTKYGVF